MKPRAHLGLKLDQKLKLAPQLRQAIALLQLNRLELRRTIREALNSNPLLERADEYDSDEYDSDERGRDEQESTTEAESAEVELDDRFNEDYGFDDLPGGPSLAGGPAPNYDEFISNRADESLQQHLLWQVNLAGFSPVDEAIAQAIVYALDEDGYLHDDLATLRISLAPEWLVSIEEVTSVLARVQQFEPLGVASRSLSECLLIQLEALPGDTEDLDLALILARDHLQALGEQDLRRLASSLGVSVPAIQRALGVIRKCNPHPGSRFSADTEQHIVPDVFVHPHGEGWRVTLNPENDPQLRLNSLYVALAGKARGADREYLSTHLKEARWLISGLAMRNQTLLAVSRAIVERQAGFLAAGETALRPLLQREVAEAAGVHESTVSRATTEKYMHTPRGIFELKYFFSVGIASDDGQDLSATAVKAHLRRLIEQEEPQRPLSDQALTNLLEEEGIQLARRTVAKYREQMGFPGSSRRRRSASLRGKG